MNTANARVILACGALAVLLHFTSGCVGESAVTVTGGGEDELKGFTAGGTVENISGSTGVTLGGTDISHMAGGDISVKGGTGMRSQDKQLLDLPVVKPNVESGVSRVKPAAGTVYGTETSRLEGSTGVTIAEDPAGREIKDGGIDVSEIKAVAVVPPLDVGEEEMRLVGKHVYVALMRQLEKRGCVLSAQDISLLRRPSDLDGLLKNVIASGYDIGYKISLAEKSVATPPPDCVMEVIGCHVDMASRKKTVIVRMRRPVKYDEGLAARYYRSRIPSVDVDEAVASLFCEE